MGDDQVCPLRHPHLCLGLFGVLLHKLPLQSKNYNYNCTSTPQNLQEGSPPRTLPLQTYNYNYNYAIALQKVPQEGGPPRTLPPIRLRRPTQGPPLQSYRFTNRVQVQKERPGWVFGRPGKC